MQVASKKAKKESRDGDMEKMYKGLGNARMESYEFPPMGEDSDFVARIGVC